MKLSKPQLELLSELIANGKYTCSRSYAPVRKLVELGLAISHEGRFGGHWLTPTEAGRNACGHQQERKTT